MQSFLTALVAVVVLVVHEQRVLALKRSSHSDAAPGKWETISGRVQYNETLFDAAQRETKEETSLEVQLEKRPILSYLAKRSHEDMIVTVYRGKPESTDVVLSDEHTEYRWMHFEEFQKYCEFEQLVEAVRLALFEAS